MPHKPPESHEAPAPPGFSTPAGSPWELLTERAVVAAEKLASAAHRIAGEMTMERTSRTLAAQNARRAKKGADSGSSFVPCNLCRTPLTHSGEPHDCKKFQEEQMKRDEHDY